MSASNLANCPKCGAPLPADAPRGLCPRCLGAMNLATETGLAGADATGAQSPLSPAELAPHFPQLEILECLGRGGMGVVYKARQKSLNRVVALKLLAPERVADAKFARRFAHEAQALATLNHPSIVTIYDFGQAGGFYFLLMEFVNGVNLRQAMKAGRFTPEQALSVVPPVCEALQYAHEHGIVHCDIKPENLLLDKEGRVKIADFGIAKMLGAESSGVGPSESQPAGTPQYMAPEQREHRGTDHRADIYSLGVVLYEMLTGELPADKLQPPSSRIRGMQIDVRLDEIVLRALEETPELRFSTAAEFRTQVETVASSSAAGPANAKPSSSAPRFSRAALFAAGWITLSVFVVPPFLWHEAKTHEFERGGPFGNLLGAVVFFAFLLPAFTAPFGATILGWIGVAQIRRSAGLLYGLGLAVTDGILFPLLTLTGLIAWFWWWVFRNLLYPHQLDVLRIDGVAVKLSLASRFVVEHWSALVVICTLLTAGPLCLLIVRMVWRAVNTPLAGSRPTAPAAPPESDRSPLGYFATFFAVSSAILGAWIWSGLLAPSPAAVFSIVLSALLGVSLAIPVRRTGRGKNALIIGSTNAAIWIILAIAGSDGARAQIHTRVFEADAKLVDQLVPGPTRKPGQMQDSQWAIRIEPGKPGQTALGASLATQTAEVSADAFARLLEEGANPPGMLDEEVREGRWWPKVATSSHYMRHGTVAGGGNLEGFLGLRRYKGGLQLQVEYNGMHGLNSAYQVVKIVWEGGAPPPDAARAFFVPVFRTDGTARYLVITVEVGNRTESAGGISNVHAEKQKATAQSAPASLNFGPVIERDVKAALDLDSGRLAELPESVTKKDSIAESVLDAVAWMEGEGMDVFADTRTHFFGAGMRVIAQDPGQWERLNASQVAAILDASTTRPATHVNLGPLDKKATYIIQTREGGKGIVQIVGSTDDGVKIRYKLVQGGATKSAQVLKPATSDATPTFGPVMERVLPSGVPCREQLFQFRNGNVYVVGNGPGTSKEEAAYDEKTIDDAGGVDMSAGSSEDQIHITGRGCIFTRDAWGLKWDSTTAEQAVQAMTRVSFLHGIVAPTKKELPITYLFKTARGEMGIMEVMGVVDGLRDSWNEKGVRFRYRLVQGTGTTTPAAATKSSLVFGPETGGMQAALDITPGEPFKIRILVRNASDRGISIDGALYRQDDECLLSDAQGRYVPVTKVTHDIKNGMKGGYFGSGQVAVFESAGLSFQDVEKAPASAGYVAKAGPGRYTLRFRLRLPGDDVPFAAGAQAWKGQLETGPVTIEVKDPSTQPVQPVADSPWSSVLGPVVERTMNDLQTTRENCALSFDSGKLLPVPANITLDTLTNTQAQPIAVAWARDNQVDAVAFVATDAGRVVKCGLLCPGLVVLRANSKEWIWDSATPRDLKERFHEAMHEWKEIPHIAEVTCGDDFPANYMILDTRTHRRGVLQIMGVADNPCSVKIRYRLVEGAAVKNASQLAKPAARNP
jgi:tRNA A-37 threonylcarbamoyl transferase component Bud32